MSEILLHHYPLSLFAEKIRRIFAYKKIAPEGRLSKERGARREIR